MKTANFVRLAIIIVVFLTMAQGAFADSEPWIDTFFGEGTSIYMDDSDNAYVTGYFNTYIEEVQDFRKSMPVFRFDVDGNRDYLNLVQYEGYSYEYLGVDITKSNDGVYVACARGYYLEDPYGNWMLTGYTGILYKFALDGSAEWSRIISPTAFYPYTFDYPISEVVIDSEDFIYVVGSKDDSGVDGFVSKYSPNGSVVWEKDNLHEYINKIRFTHSNGIILFAYNWNPDDASHLINLDNDGNILWDVIVCQEERLRIRDMELDSLDNIYLTGYYGSSQERIYYTAKYDSDGVLLWEETYGGPAEGYGYPQALALDDATNVYVTGDIEIDGENNDYCTIKYDSNGNREWIRTHNESSYDGAIDIAVDSAGDIIVTGRTSSGIVTIKYNEAGNTLWETVVTHGKYPAEMVLDSSDNIYITGKASDAGGGGMITFKLLSDGTTVYAPQDNGGNIPTAFALSQNYPNPVTSTTTIEFVLPMSGNAKLEIFDIKGRKVDSLTAENATAGENEIEYNCSLSSGVYVYKLTSDEYSAVKKMVVR